MKNLNSVAIITARGGSKRIPRKNIRNFLGKPILAYSIEAALQSKIFAEVMVSTDDEEIASIAKKYGASVPFMRSAKNSDDHSTTAQVLMEVLEEYEKRGQKFASYCCLYPTAPFVTAEKLQQAKRILEENGAYSVMPVVRFSYPIQRALQVKNGMVGLINPQYINTRSQDLEPCYHDIGQYYFGQADILCSSGQIFSEKTFPIITSELEVQDIDHEEDWAIAELKFQLLKAR